MYGLIVKIQIGLILTLTDNFRSEHCMAVMTTVSSTRVNPVTSCSSHPSEYSVLYALDMYLSGQDYTEYVSDYYDDVAGVFDTSYYNFEDYSLSFGKRKKRSVSRHKRQSHLPSSDLFFNKITDDNRQVS